MPLPPRDLSTLHLSLNPVLGEMHVVNPLTRFAPAVALFRLYKLGFDGVPLCPLLDMTSWMTMACLDDQAADHCIACALTAWHQHHGDPALVNQAFVHAASPFLVPMMVPVPAPQVRRKSEQQHRQRKPHPPPRLSKPPPPPPPPPPPRATTSPKPPLPLPVPIPETSCAALRGSVLRVICALVRQMKGQIDMSIFDAHASRMDRLSAPLACKALREFAGKLRDENCTGNGAAAAMLSEVLFKYEV